MCSPSYAIRILTKDNKKLSFLSLHFFVRVCVILFGWLDFHPQWRRLRPSPKTCSSFIPSLPGESFANVNANVLDVSSTIFLCFVFFYFILPSRYYSFQTKSILLPRAPYSFVKPKKKKKKNATFYINSAWYLLWMAFPRLAKMTAFERSSARMATLYPPPMSGILKYSFFLFLLQLVIYRALIQIALARLSSAVYIKIG